MSDSAFIIFNIFSSQRCLPFNIMSHFVFIIFNIISSQHFLLFDILSYSVFNTLVLMPFCHYLPFDDCPFDVFLLFDVFSVDLLSIAVFFTIDVLYFDILLVNQGIYSPWDLKPAIKTKIQLPTQ